MLECAGDFLSRRGLFGKDRHDDSSDVGNVLYSFDQGVHGCALFSDVGILAHITFGLTPMWCLIYSSTMCLKQSSYG